MRRSVEPDEIVALILTAATFALTLDVLTVR
jgi:hypothetical protein